MARWVCIHKVGESGRSQTMKALQHSFGFVLSAKSSREPLNQETRGSDDPQRIHTGQALSARYIENGCRGARVGGGVHVGSYHDGPAEKQSTAFPVSPPRDSKAWEWKAGPVQGECVCTEPSEHEILLTLHSPHFDH